MATKINHRLLADFLTGKIGVKNNVQSYYSILFDEIGYIPPLARLGEITFHRGNGNFEIVPDNDQRPMAADNFCLATNIVEIEREGENDHIENQYKFMAEKRLKSNDLLLDVAKHLAPALSANHSYTPKDFAQTIIAKSKELIKQVYEQK